MEKNFLRHEPENVSIIFKAPGESSTDKILLINDSEHPLQISYNIVTSGSIFDHSVPVQTNFTFDYNQDLCPINTLALPPKTETTVTFSTLFPKNALDDYPNLESLEGELNLTYTGTAIPLEDCTNETTAYPENDSILKGLENYGRLPNTGSEILVLLLASIAAVLLGTKIRKNKHRLKRNI